MDKVSYLIERSKYSLRNLWIQQEKKVVSPFIERPIRHPEQCLDTGCILELTSSWWSLNVAALWARKS